MGTLRIQDFTVPGTQSVLRFERNEAGGLVRLSGGGQVYMRLSDDGHTRVLGVDLVLMSEAAAGRGIWRQVQTANDYWVEEYHWDDTGRLAGVDGVEIQRDALHRVTACRSEAGEWLYHYAGPDLVQIDSPHGARTITRGHQGRPVRVREAGSVYDIGYDPTGRRLDAPLLLPDFHRDEMGRVWSITDDGGRVVATYLWDGFACLGRIDGPVGEPLSAAFSLDPTGTPVRVITRESVIRIPRDAFGESLLPWDGVPGLYGGLVYQGFYYLGPRAMDPRSGAFDMPDPLHGFAGDPRRAGDYRGPLLVDNPAAGPYAVCQFDPVGRADPTGEFSFWILLSDLTWSLQMNLSGWLAMDLTFNLWGSLLTSLFTLPFNVGARDAAGRFFSFDGLYSERVGTWGVRRDGLMGMFQEGRAWTFAHQVWCNGQEFEALQDARVFVPQSAFRPTLYGTLLRVAPQNNLPFLLLGDANLMSQQAPAMGWSRAGGAAEPVTPGSRVPHFPAGGFHFATVQRGVHGPQNAALTEIESNGALHSGTVDNRVIIDVPARGLGLSPDQLVLLSDATPAVYIEALAAAVEDGSITRAYLKNDVPGLGPGNVRLRGLGAAVSTEAISHGAGTPPEYLNAVGTAGAYNRGDPLRLNQGGAPVGAALISRFEAQIQIDAPLTGLTPPITVFSAQALGATADATLDADPFVLNSPANPPNATEAVVIRNGAGASLAVVVVRRTGNQWRVDRAVQPLLGGANAPVTWQRLTSPPAPLGTRNDALEAGAVFTYEAAAVRSAPGANFLRFVDSTNTRAARAVTGLGYDAIVSGTPLPGNSANPYDVERFPFQPPDQNNLTVTRAQALVLNPVLADDAVALQYYQFGAPTLAATAPAVNATVAANTAQITPVPAALPALGPARPAGVQVGGGAVTPALVQRIRATVTLDRNLATAAADLQLVPLGAGSASYDTVVQSSAAPVLVTVLPRWSGGGAPSVRVEMARFDVGELVRVQGGGVDQLYRVSAVEGATLTLDNGPALPAPAPANLTLSRLVPVAPAPQTGSSRIGAAGALVPGAANRAAFDIWTPGGLAGFVNQPVGVVDLGAGITFPVRISSVDSLDVVFSPQTPVANGAVSLMGVTPTVAGTVAQFTRDRGAVVIPGNALVVGPNLVLVIAFRDTARSIGGSLSGGTVLVPDAIETDELTRRDSLTTHELTHTLQMARLGPILLMLFPMFILEGIVEAATDVELPAFSPYVPGTLSREGSNRFLQIPDPQGVEFARNNHVQVSWAASQPGTEGPVNASNSPRTVKLGASPETNKYLFTGGDEIPSGVVNVQVRRIQASEEWTTVLDIVQQLTLGGIMTQGVGFVWGGLFTAFGKLFYALGRVLKGGTEAYPATVQQDDEDQNTRLRLDDDAGRQALPRVSRVMVRSGDSTLVRDVTGIEEGVIILSSPVSFTGQVRVGSYATHTPEDNWDWRDYYPATVPDPGRPAAIRVEAVGDNRLTMNPFDHLVLMVGEGSQQRTVTAVEDGGIVELDNPPSLNGETIFRVAKIGEEDPLGNMDNRSLIDLWGMGWMRWLFDPYGQLHYRTRPESGSFWDIVARCARYAFSSQSWSWIWFSYLTIDRVHQAEHLSQTEQEASANSGDTYTPVGRLRGNISVVGDIARYWMIPIGGIRDIDQIVINPLFDEPGVHRQHRVTWPASSGVGPTDIPNPLRAAPAGATPGQAVPDVFYAKSTADPTIAPLNSPAGLGPSDRGFIPASALLERSYGMYVAYTSPGTHRATVDGNTIGLANGTEAQNKNKQTLWFDSVVADVSVTVAGQTVNEGDTIDLVQKQQVTVGVTPNGARQYAAGLLRPATGTLLRAPDPNDPLVIAAQTVNGTEDVEISRFYRFNTGTNTYDDPALQQHGVHIPGDIHIPVRRFSIRVVDTLPVHNALSADPATIINTLAPGQDGFILVPVALGPQGLQLVSATEVATGTPVPLVLLDLNPDPPVVPDAIRPFIGPSGVVLQLSHPPGLAIPGETALALTVEVGASAPRATLQVALRLVP